MRYESESRTWSTAAGIVRARVRALPLFASCRLALVTEAIARCRGRNVAEMRALGGYTRVLLDLIDRLPVDCNENVGSPLIPASVRSELGFEVCSMRAEVQAACAAYHVANSS